MQRKNANTKIALYRIIVSWMIKICQTIENFSPLFFNLIDSLCIKIYPDSIYRDSIYPRNA